MRCIILFVALLSIVFAFPGENDEVIVLPGLIRQPTFKHYSGYLNGSPTRKLHYWFVTSQNNPDNDPLVLWFNGGPGCSSVDSLLTEHGPFIAMKDGNLEYNDNSWNKIANVLYVESPAGVGFSYSTDGNISVSDDSASLLNYDALKHFFTKFPKYKSRDFYISGESYGGIYVPTLAERIVLAKDAPYINLKGILIGNAFSSNTINWNGNVHFAYNHGLISSRAWTDIITTCCHDKDPLHCDVLGSEEPDCVAKRRKAIHKYRNINPYNIYMSCDQSHGSTLRSYFLAPPMNHKTTLSQSERDDMILRKIEDDKVTGLIPCMKISNATFFLNKKEVRYALHIPSNLPEWEMCSDNIHEVYQRIYQDMNRQYNVFFGLKDFRIWLYNGDVDMMCSYLSEEWYFERFNRSVLIERAPWMYTEYDNTQQVGGFVQVWDKFVLLTVRGAGHMVPSDKPLQAYHVFDAFIKGNNL